MSIVAVSVYADATISIPDVEIKSGKSAVIAVTLAGDQTRFSIGWDITLPTGVTIGSKSDLVNGEIAPDLSPLINTSTAPVFKIGATSATEWTASNGVLMYITIYDDGSHDVGDVLQGSIDNIELGNGVAAEALHPAGSTFNITIVEDKLDLYDTDTTLPAASTESKVIIHRNFKGGIWNSFVAPFDITEAQYKAAFGDDVQVAKFSSQNISDPDTEIVIGFTTVTETDANTPVIVMPSADLTQVTFTGTIDVDAEDEPAVQVGKKAAEKSFAYGTYVPKTIKSDGDAWSFPVYLKDNKFYYAPAAGVTIKGYRAYFVMADALSAYTAGYEVKMAIDEDPTAIGSIDADYENGMTYTVDGKFVGKDVDLKRMQKGIYIVNGKKVVNK